MTTVKNMKKKTAAFTSSNNAVSLLNQVLCYLCGIGRNVLSLATFQPSVICVE